LYKYVTGIVQEKKSKMLAINGMPDHIHIFIGYKPTISLPELVKDIKVASTLFINGRKLVTGKFAWQEGYGAFSYSLSQVDRVCKYIINQELHHKKLSFNEEYIKLLKGFRVEYDKDYLFDFFT
jgi:putative transposase